MLPSAGSFRIPTETPWDNNNGSSLNANGFGHAPPHQDGMFANSTPGFKQPTSAQQFDMEESFSLSNLYEEFATLLENLHFNVYKDIFDVVKEFGRVSSSRAIKLYQYTGTESGEFENAALESKFWSLLHILLTFRTADSPEELSIYPFSSNAAVQEQYLRKHRQAREHWLILAWIQDSLDTPDEPPELRGAKWMYTRNAIQQKERTVLQPSFIGKTSVLGPDSNVNIVSQLDADAPLREQKHIAQEDESYDRTIYKYIFTLIRARKYTEAYEVCERTGNWTLSLALRGLDEFYDPEIEGHILGESAEHRGIQNKMLWRRMCWKLTQADNIDPYERGIYGILSSDLESVLKLSDSWELQLLAFMSYLVATEAEVAMQEAGRVDPEIEAMPVPKSSFTSSGEILEILAHSANPEIKKQSRHVLRQLLGSVINNDITSMIDALAINIESLMSDRPSTFSAEDTMKVLRIVTHLILFLQQLGLNVGESQSYSIIIDAYIELLRGEGKNDLIPLYVSYLDDDLASDTYSYLLATITDSEERKKHLQLAKKYGLDMPNTIRKAVKRVFDEDPEQYRQSDTISFSSAVSQNDQNLSSAVAWYKEALMWPDAIHSSVILYRLYLGVGKIQAAREFGEAVPWAFLSNKYDAYHIGQQAGPISLGPEKDAADASISDAERMEFSEYGRMVTCIQKIEAWNQHYANGSSQGLNKERRSSIASNTSTLSTPSNFQKRENTQLWKREAILHVTSISDTIHDLSRTWMVSVLNHPEADEETINQVTRLRTWYVPFLLMELLRILIEAQDAQFNFLRQAARLATFVASEDLKLYQLFIDSDTLTMFLGGVADACADGVVRGEEGIFE